MTNSCKTCKFWTPHPLINNQINSSVKGKQNDNCLRYPPQYVLLATPQGLGNALSFPSTESDQWCGEYQIAEEVTPKEEINTSKPTLLK